MQESLAQVLWQEAREAVAFRSPQRGSPSVSPVARYLDPTRHEAETEALRGLPHAVGPACRVAHPGDWFTARILNVPVLVSRGADDVVRAFINVCRHRGAQLAASGECGSNKTRFVCPYHSWSYDCKGELIGRPHEQDFPHVPREAAQLVPLPVAVRCGLVWVVPRALEQFDWDGYFGPMATELEQLGYDARSQAPHERHFDQASNWKLVLDANLESYHFQYAHRATIAHLFHDNVVQQAVFGPHQRIVLPKRSMGQVEAQAISWDLLGRHCNIIYYFFPSTFLLWEGDHLNGFCVTPVAPDRCWTDSWMIVPEAHHARRQAEHWTRNFNIFWDAIDEDFALAASMQSGLASGANEALRFGTNEFACDLFHREVEKLLGT